MSYCDCKLLCPNFKIVLVQGLSAVTAEDGERVTWDARRSARMLAVGLLMSGPCLHLWFGAVAKFFPNRDMVSTLKKLVLGQLFYGPAFCAAFFTVNSYAQGNESSISFPSERQAMLGILFSCISVLVT